MAAGPAGRARAGDAVESMTHPGGNGRSNDPSAEAQLTGAGRQRPEGGGASALLELVLTSPKIEAYLDELAVTVAGLSPQIAGCGVTVRRNGNALTVASSNELASAVDEVQYGIGTGPCLECLATERVLTVVDMVEESRWGQFPSHALGHGVRSTLSVPLVVGGRTIGALNAYGSEPGMFVGVLRDQLVVFAAEAQISLALALRSAEQSELVDQLHTAMQSRSVIDQALGIVMARQRCTAAEAFAVLRSASQSRNRKIAEIAADVITATTGRRPEEGHFER